MSTPRPNPMLRRMLIASSVRVPKVKMNDEREMPAIAFGTHVDKNVMPFSEDKQIRDAVLHAIDIGYRHFDTASIYKMEDQVGEAVNIKIAEGAVKREDMFITAKLWNTHHKREQVAQELMKSLENMSLDYVDLYLMHWPIGFNEDHTFSDVDYMETWRGMEDVRSLGLAKSIGVSNFNVEQLQRLLKEAAVKPAALQIEVHPGLVQLELRALSRAHKIVVMGHSPLGSLAMRSRKVAPGPGIDDFVLKTIAGKYGKTKAQVVLRWSVEKNVVPIPSSVDHMRQLQNYEIFGFKLTEEDIAQIDGFNTSTRLQVLPSSWQEHKYYPFEKVETPTEDPSIKTDQMEIPSQGTSIKTDQMETPSEDPSIKTDQMETLSEGPSIKTDQMETPSEGPSIKTDQMETPSEGPSIKTDQMETPSEDPSIKTDQMETPSEGPSIKTDQMETPSEGPSIKTDQMETPSEGPSIKTDQMDA